MPIYSKSMYAENVNELDIDFSYPIKDNPILDEIKKLSNLKLNDGENETEKASFILGYSHGLFIHDGDNTPSAFDPLTILKEALSGQSFRCVEYSILATGLLWAYGIVARTVGLKTKDVETREYGAGHVVIEYWDNNLTKWVMCDVQAGVIPVLDDKYLSAAELNVALCNKKAVDFQPVNGTEFDKTSSYDGKLSYAEWIFEYLFYIDTPIDLSLGNEDARKKQIMMLVQSGAYKPKIFQNSFTMNAVYTHSLLDFYPKSTRKKG